MWPRRSRAIVLAVLVGIVVAVVPFVGGALGLIIGVTYIVRGARALHAARYHQSPLPVSHVDAAKEGDVIRIRGHVATATESPAFLSDKKVAYSVLTGVLLVDEEQTRFFSARKLCEEVVVREPQGEAMLVMEGARLLSRNATEVVGAFDDNRVRAVVERAYPGSTFDMGTIVFNESSIDEGDELEVVGRVERVEMLETPTSAGYRGHAMTPRITLVSPDINNPLIVTNYNRSEVDELTSKASLKRNVGLAWLAAAIVNLPWSVVITRVLSN